MMKRTKIALVAGAAVLAMAGVGGGIAFAADSTPTAPPPTSSAATPAQHAAHAAHKARGVLRRVEHGQFTVHTKTGDQVIDVQHGQVTAVSASAVTVKSQDGFTATYTVGGTAKIRVQQKTSAIANVHTGDNVLVAATHSGNTDTLRRLADPKK